MLPDQVRASESMKKNQRGLSFTSFLVAKPQTIVGVFFHFLLFKSVGSQAAQKVELSVSPLPWPYHSASLRLASIVHLCNFTGAKIRTWNWRSGAARIAPGIRKSYV